MVRNPALSSAAVAASIVLESLPALCWICLPHCAGVFTRHCSPHSIVVIPSLVVIDCIVQRCRLWRSMPALRWCLCQHCAGIVSLIARASLHNIVVVAASLSYLALLSSIALANVFVCGGHLWHCAGVVSLITLAFWPLLHWHHHPHHTGVCMLMTSSLHVALLLHWCH